MARAAAATAAAAAVTGSSSKTTACGGRAPAPRAPLAAAARLATGSLSRGGRPGARCRSSGTRSSVGHSTSFSFDSTTFVRGGVSLPGSSALATAAAPLGGAASAPRASSAPRRRLSATSASQRSEQPRRAAALRGTAGAAAAPGAAAAGPAAPVVESFDFLVLGSGIAGLSYALKVAQYGRVAVVTKADASEGCTAYAQGGICAVLDASDSVESHVRDTLVAGAFLNDRNAVEVVCREGPRYVLELAKFGAEFTRCGEGHGAACAPEDGVGPGGLHLTREGGHSARRIVHAADATGAEIERALVTTAAAHPNIHFFEHHLAVDLLIDEVEGVRYCLGADVLDQHASSMTRFVAPVTMLATGGAGQVYPNTTNPGVTTGDGIAMAYRAKAAVANMEFVQFHPTSLYRPACPAPLPAGGAAAELAGGRSFLITEAVRGEGGMLYNLGGERFMSRYDAERMELAPRDIVARSIQAEMLGRGDSHVLLDISHKPAWQVLEHFPNIAAHCASLGIDITQDPIPVVPAQHYLCGGVQTGLLGETHVQGLYACGEVACSGLHGANRLASNSLLEGLVFANRAVGPSVAHAEHAVRCAGGALRAAAAAADFSTGGRAPRPLSPSAAAWVAAKRRELQGLMWGAAGIVRRQADMKRALQDIAQLYVETKALAETYGVNTELVELRNLVTVGELVMSSALQRRESRGGHYCADYPEAVPQECVATIINTPVKRRLDLAKVSTGGAVLFGGPSSPKRGAGARSGDLLTTRSGMEE